MEMEKKFNPVKSDIQGEGAGVRNESDLAKVRLIWGTTFDLIKGGGLLIKWFQLNFS